MYTMKSHSLNSITCDDNGAHIQKRTAKTNYFITRKSNSTEIKAQIIPKNGRGEMADIILMFIQPLVI